MSRKRKLYDLSWGFQKDMPVYGMRGPGPGGMMGYSQPMIGTHSHPEGTTMRPDSRGWMDDLVAFFPHTGTHIDAPLHKNPDGWSVDEIPLDRLVGNGVVVDISKGEMGEITAEDLEKATPKIEKGDLLIVNTGWHRNYCSPSTDWEKCIYFLNRRPGIVESGVNWCIKRGIKTFLIDVIGVDAVKTTNYGDGTWPAHSGFLSANIPMVQLLGAQIDEVTGKRGVIFCAPVKFVRGVGFPVRVIAMVEE